MIFRIHSVEQTDHIASGPLSYKINYSTIAYFLYCFIFRIPSVEQTDHTASGSLSYRVLYDKIVYLMTNIHLQY